jgi:hypothetical protein
VSSAGSGMALNVAAGSCAIPAANGTGSVLCASDAVETVTSSRRRRPARTESI